MVTAPTTIRTLAREAAVRRLWERRAQRPCLAGEAPTAKEPLGYWLELSTNRLLLTLAGEESHDEAAGRGNRLHGRQLRAHGRSQRAGGPPSLGME